MEYLNAGDGAEFDADFESYVNTPTPPTTAHWRLLNISAKRIVADWDPLSVEVTYDTSGMVALASVEFEVPGTLNVLDDCSKRREEFELQVVADLGTARQKSERYPYYVRTLGPR